MISRAFRIGAVLFLSFSISITTAFAVNDDSERYQKKDITEETTSLVTHSTIEGMASDRQKQEMLKAYFNSSKKLKAQTEWDSNERWIGVNTPEPYDVFYCGSGYIEEMWTDITCYDTWEYYYTRPGYAIFDDYGNIVVDVDGDENVDVDSSNRFTGYISLSDLDVGRYELWVWAVPSYSDGSFVEDWGDWDDVPSVCIPFYVESLSAPKSVKANAGKKKVTVTYKKVPGADEFKIYRSTSKYGPYSHIKTTTSAKYVDKKVKKGKRYYYKVRSYRSETDISSSYSGVAKSGKVK